jgi:putative ABC transport system ATP-binding protein
MNQAHVELKNVSKAVLRKVNNNRIKTKILSNLDIEVQSGELVTIMGASGSGKTTLLRLINRLSEADSGTIMLDGRDIRDYAPTELRRKVGMVLQLPVMFKGSVRDNIAFGVKLWGGNIDVEALSRACDIPESLLNADAEQLSVGEKQRVQRQVNHCPHDKNYKSNNEKRCKRPLSLRDNPSKTHGITLGIFYRILIAAFQAEINRNPEG